MKMVPVDREEEGSVQLSDIVYIADYFKKGTDLSSMCVHTLIIFLDVPNYGMCIISGYL